MEVNKVYLGECLPVLRKLEDKSIDLIIVDPPYGINYQSARRIDTERFERLTGDKTVDTTFIEECFRILKDNSAFYLFTRWDVYPEWLESIKNNGFNIKNCIIWDRVVHGLGDLKGSYAPQYDMIIFATKGKHILKNGRPKDIIKVKRVEPNKLVHPTQKPIELLRKLVQNSSKPNEIVLDCFVGSGSTLLAAKQLGRNYIGIEKEKLYYNITLERLKQKTLW